MKTQLLDIISDITKVSDIVRISGILPNIRDIELYTNAIELSAHKEIKTYYSKAIQKMAGISEIQIKHWTQTGVIIPFKDVRGTGRMRVYDHQNLIEAMICRELNQYSINYGMMKSVLDFLRNKKWRFEFAFTVEQGTHIDSTESVVSGSISFSPIDPFPFVRSHTIWEYLKFYPQNRDLLLVLWKGSPQIMMQDSLTGEYQFYIVTGLPLHEITSQCRSAIIINFSRLVSEAGNFYEGEN